MTDATPLTDRQLADMRQRHAASTAGTWIAVIIPSRSAFLVELWGGGDGRPNGHLALPRPSNHHPGELT